MKRRKHRKDHNHRKNGYVAGNPRTRDQRSKSKRVNFDEEPDIFQLEDWAGENHPEFLKAIHYIHDRYTPLLKLWKNNGKPIII